jgi:hypothetical protein
VAQSGLQSIQPTQIKDRRFSTEVLMNDYNTHGLVPFASTTAVGAVDRTREIRDSIGAALETNPKLFSALSAHLAPQGTAGSVHFDHAIAGDLLLQNVPALARYELNQRQAWLHLDVVLKKRGYIFSGGYIVGHVKEREEEIVEAPPVQVATAPEAVTAFYQH